MSTTYPKGTNVRTIRNFDRGIKVVFECKEHPGPWYASKEPAVSAWFPANTQAVEIQNGMAKDPCPHTSSHDVWITATEYTNNA